MRVVIPSSCLARWRPWLASCSTRVCRILTKANSEATKNALARTMTTVTTMARVGLIGRGRASSQVVESVPRDGGDAGGARFRRHGERAGRAGPAAGPRTRQGVGVVGRDPQLVAPGPGPGRAPPPGAPPPAY